MKPMISGTLTAWDVGISTCTINFSWNGGLVAGNRLTIVETGLYHDATGISATYHIITPEVAKELGLKNGTTYHATITMINYDGIAVSETSQQFILKCYATPLFRINNLYDGIILNSSSCTVAIDYSGNGMDLSTYKFNLYDSSGLTVIESSIVFYYNNDNSSYTFRNLNDGTDYYIEAIGETVYGMELRVIYRVSVRTNTAPVKNTVSAFPTKDGNITINTTCLRLHTKSSDNLEFINNEEVSLLNNKYIKYSFYNKLDDFNVVTTLRSVQCYENMFTDILTIGDDVILSTEIVKEYIDYPLILKNFQWVTGTSECVESSSGTYYVDTNYCIAPPKIAVSRKYDGDFLIHCYDSEYNKVNTLIINAINTEYDTSNYSFVRFAFPKNKADSDLNEKIVISFNYGEKTNIEPNSFTRGDSLYINAVDSASLRFVLHDKNNHYTCISDQTYPLNYDFTTKKFKIDENKKFKINIKRKDSNYSLRIKEI